jgi:hypothetical protein
MVEIENIGKLIACLSPDRYTERKEGTGSVDKPGFKKALKQDFWKASKEMGNYNLKPSSAEEHTLVYDSSSETLEPVYFWVLDRANFFFKGKEGVEKLVDSFTSSAGSGHFSELMGKASRMQEEASKILGNVNAVIKSIINIIYDLKEYEIKLSQYKYANSKNKEEKESGLLGLKQIWMDNVDVKRGRGSINMLAQDLNFVTIRDAFMIANSIEEVDGLDLNDRVKRILKPRLAEFLKWRELSEREIKKRYEIEKTYLKSQVNALKLYSRWAKPYLSAAVKLEQKEPGTSPDIVTAFNTVRLELTLLCKDGFDFQNAVYNKNLPESFRNIKLKRDYYSCVLIDFYFRGIPQRAGQHYVFGGRAEVNFRAYSLNKEEIDMLKKRLDESDLKDALNLVAGTTEESLGELQEDIDYFLKQEKAREEEKKEEDVNPFAALLGLQKKKPSKEEEKEFKEIKPDNYVEKMARDLAEVEASQRCFNIFDIYKKAHGMASHPGLYNIYGKEYEKPKLSKFLGI